MTRVKTCAPNVFFVSLQHIVTFDTLTVKNSRTFITFIPRIAHPGYCTLITPSVCTARSACGGHQLTCNHHAQCESQLSHVLFCFPDTYSRQSKHDSVALNRAGLPAELPARLHMALIRLHQTDLCFGLGSMIEVRMTAMFGPANTSQGGGISIQPERLFDKAK